MGKTNAVLWGSVTVHDLVNHVLHYIVWALDHDKIDGCGVTHAWLEKSKSGDNCGAMRLVHGKVYLRIVIESLVNDLPDTSVAKTQFLRVLSPFDSYASFSNIFGKKKRCLVARCIGARCRRRRGDCRPSRGRRACRRSAGRGRTLHEVQAADRGGRP